MSGPMIIKEELDEERLNEVQSVISKYINKPGIEKIISGQEDLNQSLGSAPLSSSHSGGNSTGNESTCNSPTAEFSSETSSSGPLPSDDETKKYKICIIEKGTIIFPDERGKYYLDDSDKDGCIIKELPEKETHEQGEATGETQKNAKKSTGSPVGEKCDCPKTNVKESDTTKCGPAKTGCSEDPQYKKPSINRLDSDVMNKLLDYYRKFNERQLGLAVNDQQPGYKASTEDPTPVICDNDIIKEAVIRVGQKLEAGEAIKEPTLVDDPDEDIMEPESKPLNLNFKEEAKEEESEAVKRRNAERAEFDEIFDSISHSFDEDFWMYGANFIEKALEKKIDGNIEEKRARRNRWGQDDIFKLVHMLSTNYESVECHTEGGWNSGAYVAQYDEYRDDLVYKLEELYDGELQEKVYEETLFDRLKRAPASDDRQELRVLVAENSYFHKTGQALPRVYQGGEELLAVKDTIKNLFSFEWLWRIYDHWFGSQASKARKSHNATKNNGWLSWFYYLPKIRTFTGWFRRKLAIPGSGKPIYKHVEYQSTDFVDWQERYASELQGKRILKNRRGRNAEDETVLDVDGGKLDEEQGVRTISSHMPVNCAYGKNNESLSLHELDTKRKDCVLYFDA